MGAIVSTSFPRSASRFAASLFTTLYGSENYEEGYCKLHLLNRDNAFTVIRKPEQAIPSWVAAVQNHFDGFASFTANNVLNEVIPFYVEFMNMTVARVGSIYITTFEAFTGDTQNELNKISVHFDLPYVIFDSAAITVDPRHVPGGNPVTADSLVMVDRPEFVQAQKAYKRVIEAIQ